ncbi:PTS system, glucose-specific IIB component [Salmonella sp. NCTC 11881]|nr:PTS system, glucose-specific IIB component [Salmonella sp. NCTC 11881]
MKRFNLLQMLQSIGRSLMIPIAMLPAAGILLAFGVSFSGSQYCRQPAVSRH